MLEFIGSILTGLEDLIHRNRWRILFGSVIALLVASILMNNILLKELQETQELAQEATELYQEAIGYAASISAEYAAYRDSIENTSEPSEEGSPSPARTLEVTATAYCPCVSCCGIWSESHPCRQGTGYVQKTSSGTIPTANRTIATDPDIIPEGSQVILNGYTYIAEDTGSGVKGDHIDIYFPTHEEALAFGRQTVEVTIIEK